MKIIRQTFLLFLMISAFLPAQAQVIQTYFGRAGKSEIITEHTILSNGNTVAVGYAWSGTSMTTSDAFIMCIDPSDNVLWAKEIGTSANDRFLAVTPTSDGGCVAVGFANMAASFYTGNHAIAYKFDAAGNILWNRIFKTASSGELFLNVIEVPGSGHIACIGNYNWIAGADAGMIINLDNNGNLLWSRIYDRTGSDELRDLVYLNGKLIATGFYQGASWYDGTLLAVDESNGNIIWSRTFDYAATSGGGNSCQIPIRIQLNGGKLYIDVDLLQNYNSPTVVPSLVSFDTNGLNPVCLEYSLTGSNYSSNNCTKIVSENEIYLTQSPGNTSWDPIFSITVAGMSDGVITKIKNMTNAAGSHVYSRRLSNTGEQAFGPLQVHNNRIRAFGSVKNDPAFQLGGNDVFRLDADTSFPVTPFNCVSNITGQRFANPSVTLDPNFSFTVSTPTFPAPTITPVVTPVNLTSVNPCASTNLVIVNNYAAVLGLDSCSNIFTVDTATGFNVGDTILIIQMKGAQIDTSNTASFGTITDYKSAGNYEVNVISARTGNDITLQYALDRTYDIPDGKVQLVRVPYYQNYTVSQPHTCLPWNGSKGGIFAIHVAGTLTLSDDIDVSGKGFRGGSQSVSHYNGCSFMDYYYILASGFGGQKGEGVSVYNTRYEAGRGALANGGGGGNDHNSGGAGGGNYGDGGHGGDQWNAVCPQIPIGGSNALALTYSNTQNKIFLGGGGGGGHQNNSAGTSGVNGGGIMIIQASAIISNNGKLRANGADNNVMGRDDGAGGGGGGGSILLSTGSISGTAVSELKGGKGGSLNAVECHGPGGGGGGGILWTNTTLPGTWSTDLSGGVAGTGTCGTGAHGAKDGSPGGILAGLLIPQSTTPFITPIVKPHLATNSPLCAGDTIKLSVTNNYAGSPGYSWTGPAAYSSNQPDPVIPNAASTHAGLYTLTVSVANCKLSDTIRVTVRENPNVSLGNDTGICQSSIPFLLQSPQPTGTQYLWNDASTGSQLSVNSTGKYWLRVTDTNGCIGSDTISLKVIADPVFSLGADTNICDKTSLHIGTTIPNALYRWNTGSVNSHIDVSATGTYILSADLDGCVKADTIQVTVVPNPNVSLGNDTGICQSAAPFLLQSPQPTGTQYLWSDASTGPQLSVNSTGKYWLRVTDPNGCTGSDTISLKVIADPIFSLGADTNICDKTSLHIGTTIPNALYRWNTGSVNSHIDVSATGTYILNTDLDGCVKADTIRVTVLPNPNVNLGNDTGICQSSAPLLLQSPQPAGTQYLWNDGSAGPQLSVNSTGKYWLRVTDANGCIGSDTISLKVIADPVIDIGPDTTICEQTPLQIGETVPGAGYQWNNGSTDSHIEVSATGAYVLLVNLDGCIAGDTIQVTAMPTPDISLGSDRDICPGQAIPLDATYGTNSSYLWNTGAVTPVVTAISEGLYTVRVTSAYHCTASDSIFLTGRAFPSVSLPPDTTFCEGNRYPLQLTFQQTGADYVFWQDGSRENTFFVTHGGDYILTAVNQCGAVSDTVRIRAIFCDIWLPDAFTPNGDGINDIFRVLGSIDRLQQFEFSIFNRWGQRIFHTTDKAEGWNGTFNGEPQMIGTYSYMLTIKLNGTSYLHNGNFHLIR